MKNFTIFNDTMFEAGMCLNGGHYGFWETYTYVPEDPDNNPEHYVREFHATHEFSMCSRCGEARDYGDYEDHSSCDPRVSVEDALKQILNALSRSNERAQFFDGPAFRVVVEN